MSQAMALFHVSVWICVFLLFPSCYVFQTPCKPCQTSQDCAGKQQCKKLEGQETGACINEEQSYLCTGFVCKNGDSRLCYSGPAGTEGKSKCQAGFRVCVNNAWGPCQNEVLPGIERCNGEDDDCDGLIDEGVLCVTTLAGGNQGYENGLGRNARFNEPRGLVRSNDGSLYVSDSLNARIRKIEFKGEVDIEVQVLHWAGVGPSTKLEDGFRLSRAAFGQPRGITLDSKGNLYVADAKFQAIRKIDTGDQVTTLSGPKGTPCKLSNNGPDVWFEPTGIVFGQDDSLWIANTQAHQLYKLKGLERDTCEVELVVGSTQCRENPQASNCYKDGVAKEAQFWDPSGVAIDTGGNVYLADYNNNMIRKIDKTGNVTTVAGGGSQNPGFKDGKGTEARFRFPRGIAIDTQGILYIADTDNHAIRKIDKEGNVTTLAGTGKKGFQDGDGKLAQFHTPWAIAVDPQGNLYVADTKNHRIRKVTPQSDAL